jgi:hypothetical protein
MDKSIFFIILIFGLCIYFKIQLDDNLGYTKEILRNILNLDHAIETTRDNINEFNHNILNHELSVDKIEQSAENLYLSVKTTVDETKQLTQTIRNDVKDLLSGEKDIIQYKEKITYLYDKGKEYIKKRKGIN